MSAKKGMDAIPFSALKIVKIVSLREHCRIVRIKRRDGKFPASIWGSPVPVQGVRTGSQHNQIAHVLSFGRGADKNRLEIFANIAPETLLVKKINSIAQLR